MSLIGILQLDTNFPRIPGDIGNEFSFRHPVIYETVKQLNVASVVSDAGLSQEFESEILASTRKLQDRGASVIGTSCGFLVSAQQLIQSNVDVPVLSSSLLLLPLLRTTFGEQTPIGILTFDAEVLASYENITQDQNIYIQGLDQRGELYRCIKEDCRKLDTQAARDSVMACTNELISRHQSIAVFLIECTNISPYKKDIQVRFKLPTFDLIDGLDWLADANH